MKKAARRLVRVILSIFAMAFLSLAQTDEYGRWANWISEPCELDYSRYTEQEAAILKNRWKQIEDENAIASYNEWAGDYTGGTVDEIDMIVLRWAQNSGFVFASIYNCLPILTGLNCCLIRPQLFIVRTPLMRRIIFILLLFIPALLLSPVQAQQSGAGPDRAATRNAPAVAQGPQYQLGTKIVTIPPPSGFAEALTQSDNFARIMIGTEVPNNEVLAAHLPLDVLSKMKKGEQYDYDFYTKVSVLKLVKALDMNEAEFASFVAHFESTAPQTMDINSPVMKGALKSIQEGLSAVSGKDVPLEFTQPQNLGSFGRSKDAYSMMLLMSLKTGTAKQPLLCGLSLVRVRQRLLFVYTYRKFTSEKDAELLRDFTQEWVKQILAANK